MAPFHLTGTFMLGAALLLGACTSLDIRGEDHSVSFPTVRLAHEFRKSVAFEIAYTEGEGTSDQDVPNGEEVDFGGATVSGPAVLSNRFFMATRSADFAFPWELKPDKSALTCRVGAAWTDLRVRATTGVTVLADKDRYGGLLLGCDIWYEPISRLRVGVRAEHAETFTWSVAAGWRRTDVTVSYRLIGRSRLFAGYRTWTLEYENDQNDSGVDLDMRGPVFGLEIRL